MVLYHIHGAFSGESVSASAVARSKALINSDLSFIVVIVMGRLDIV